MAGVFAVASNDFITECHDLEEEEDHCEDEVVAGGKEQEGTDLVDDGPARWKARELRWEEDTIQLPVNCQIEGSQARSRWASTGSHWVW
jgi:hypothetical protein